MSIKLKICVIRFIRVIRGKRFIQNSLIYIITGYQHLISPNLPKVCRFYPTCSEYAKEALLTHGVRKGLLLSFKRILRCNPFCHGGYDPVQ